MAVNSRFWYVCLLYTTRAGPPQKVLLQGEAPKIGHSKNETKQKWTSIGNWTLFFSKDWRPVWIWRWPDFLFQKILLNFKKTANLAAPRLRGSKAPRIQGSKAPRLQGSKAPRLQGSKAPRFPVSKVFWIPGFKVPCCPVYQCPVSRFKNFHILVTNCLS